MTKPDNIIAFPGNSIKKNNAPKKSNTKKNTGPDKKTKYKWAFAPRFRRNAFGWRSETPIKRIKEAISEIKKIAKKEPLLAAEGAVLFLTKLSPSLGQVDSSSGRIGNATYNAIETLVQIIKNAPANKKTRKNWLIKLEEAKSGDGMCYLDSLSSQWGDLCGSPEIASEWADDYKPTIIKVLSSEKMDFNCTGITIICLSCLFKAQRYDEIFEILSLEKKPFWYFHRWGVMAFAAQDKIEDALCLAEKMPDDGYSKSSIHSLCEKILLDTSKPKNIERAYKEFSYKTNQKNSYLATFNAILKKYPHKDPEIILKDLIKKTPGEEGKWFASAMKQGYRDLAIELAIKYPCEPKTLNTALKNSLSDDPDFVLKVGPACLLWILQGYGYDLKGYDIFDTCEYYFKAAIKLNVSKGLGEKILKNLEKFPNIDTWRKKMVQDGIKLYLKNQD